VEAPLEWTQYEYDLSAYQGQNIRVGVHCVSNDSFVLQMDEFVVEGTLGVNDLNKLEMIIYPNPVDGDIVTIQSPIDGLKEVQIYTVTGRKVMDTTINGNTLDVSSFNSGFYMLKVTINGQSKISKLVVR